MNLPPKMLSGYRVLDITQFVAGPTCTRLLAEAGADVIKVELAPFGDRSRFQGLKPRDPAYKNTSQSTYFFQQNHSKRSLALDLKHEKSRAILRRLAAGCDVLVENFTPGVMKRAGLGYDELKAINPKLIMCSISFAGQTGPLSDKPGFDYIAQAFAGITGVIGEPDGKPAQVPVAIGDASTGVAAAMAVGFALLHRERTGEGQFIEASLLDTYFHMHEANVPKVALRGDSFVPKREGSLHPNGGPVGVFDCGRGEFLVICALAHQWPQMVRALGRPELENDPRFASARARSDNNKAVAEIVEAWLQRFPSREAAIAALEQERIPCAPVLTLNDAMAQPHLVERGTVRRVDDPQIGQFAIPGNPVRFSAWQPSDQLKADLLGQHNEDILREIGLSDAEIENLYAEKVLVQDRALRAGRERA
ncbi:CoA transferase [Bradyrhizobium sp. NP1]|uniref:CaiB/BaiF CoA transferase family protein n=1 Tax=Bradyrhizobium sp. NP1 TaxID=3049772 RepID=UPI0025A5A11E|nr:CoA transferase [Bradyrhizobium sp. NP1]WJR77418.1 CoA transferase [Bradyrhizobium sp. NP1]